MTPTPRRRAIRSSSPSSTASSDSSSTSTLIAPGQIWTVSLNDGKNGNLRLIEVMGLGGAPDNTRFLVTLNHCPVLPVFDSQSAAMRYLVDEWLG